MDEDPVLKTGALQRVEGSIPSVSACEVAGCNSSAHTLVTWGGGNLPTSTANLCKQHSDELWKSLNPLVQSQRLWVIYNSPALLSQRL
jgi:hypothetical protein